MTKRFLNFCFQQNLGKRQINKMRENQIHFVFIFVCTIKYIFLMSQLIHLMKKSPPPHFFNFKKCQKFLNMKNIKITLAKEFISHIFIQRKNKSN